MIFIILFLILNIYVYYSDKKIDTFADTTPNMINSVRNIYLTDIEAIRNLNEIATKLRKDGIILPCDTVINSGSISGKLIIDGENNINNKITVNGETNFNNTTNINNTLNIKSPTGIVSLEGSSNISDGNNSYMILYPKTKLENNNSVIGFYDNLTSNLTIKNNDEGAVIFGTKNKKNALSINTDGSININGNLNINGTMPLPLINISYKQGLSDTVLLQKDVDKNIIKFIGDNNENPQIKVKKCLPRTVTSLISCKYTPKLVDSVIYILCNCNYFISGYSTDDIISQIYIDNNLMFTKKQSFNNNAGGGTRSGVIFPISYMHKKTTKAEMNIEIKLDTNNTDDFVLIHDNGFQLQIIEYIASILP